MVSSYDTMYKQLPTYFRPIVELTAILKAHGYALDTLSAISTQIAANNFIQTADEDTLAEWERILGINYQFGDTIEYRREQILQKFYTIVPFSYGFLIDRMNELYGEDGYTLSIDPVQLKLKVNVTSSRYGAITLLYNLLWEIVPAHVQIVANQQVTNNIGGCRLYSGGSSSSTIIQTIGGTA